MTVPKADVRRMMHALREPVGAFAINLSLLEDDALSEDARKRVDAMRKNVRQMTQVLCELTARFELEVESAGSTEISTASDARFPNRHANRR